MRSSTFVVRNIERGLRGAAALAKAIGGRYLGADRAEEFGRRDAVPGELLVRLRPECLIATADVAGY